MSTDTEDLMTREICIDCISDDTLVQLVAKKGKGVECSYCRKHFSGLDMKTFALIVDPYLRKFLAPGDMVPDFSSSSDDWGGEIQEGEDLEYIIQEEVGIDYDPAKDLIEILQYLDPADSRDGGEPFYSDDVAYIRADVEYKSYHYGWNAFTESVKHDRRYFNDQGMRQLEALLGKSDNAKARQLQIFEIGPGCAINKIYRARLPASKDELFKWFNDPHDHLCPPLSDEAKAGRMNAQGISVFYGALSEETAVAEVRPSVGSSAVVGMFNVTRKLKLLNLPLIDIYFSGSIFDHDYEDRAARARFLEDFHSIIAKPIQPSEELLEYIPTQIVAEYVSNKLYFDGILYGSAQVAGSLLENDEHRPNAVRVRKLTGEELTRCNVVLFHGQSLITRKNGPGTTSGTVLKLQPDSVKAIKVMAVRYEQSRDWSVEYLSGR